MISKKNSIPTSQQYSNSLFPHSNLDWKLIYLLPKTNYRALQYKILNNVSYLYKMLFCFGKTPSPFCSLCKLHDETLIHLFSSCNQIISLWVEIKLFFSEYIQLTLLSPQIATFGFVKGNDKSFLIQNKILMVFKLYVYKSRSAAHLVLMHSFSNWSK